MAPFDRDSRLTQQPDFRLARHPVTLFWRTTTLAYTIRDLEERGYTVLETNPAGWEDTNELHSARIHRR